MNVSFTASTTPPRLSAIGARLLSEAGWLTQVPADFRDALLARVIWRTSEPGAEFIHAGDTEGGLFGIARGTAEVSLLEGHPDARIMDLVHAGFWAGHRPLFGRPRQLTIAARTELLWALVPQLTLMGMLTENPGWWQHIALLGDNNIDHVQTSLADLSRRDSSLRAIAVLLRLGGCRHAGPPPGSVTDVRISQSDLAAMAVMSRNTLGTIVGDLVERGLISANYHSITLEKPGALRAMLADD
ncbi:MAG: Crp/Fnr family transcriptional regulator [Polymorphobacter sp.]